MSPTVFLDTPMDGNQQLECETVQLLGDVVWASPDDGQERVIPLANVTGVTGAEVTQEIEEVEFPGGRVTELVTHIS